MCALSSLERTDLHGACSEPCHHARSLIVHAHQDHETIDSCIWEKGQNSTVNGVYYLGQASSWQLCEALCSGWESCVSFDWHAPGEGAFTHTCYARTTDYFQPKLASGRVVGMRPGSVPGTAPACVIPPAPPGPPTPPPQPPSDIDCEFRSLGEKSV